MSILKAAAFLALLAVGEVNARFCPAKNPYPQDKVCRVQGYVSNTDGMGPVEIQKNNPEECAQVCYEDPNCGVFNYEDGRCRFFHNTMSGLTFTPTTDGTGRIWYDMGCFDCEASISVTMSDDFSDGNLDDWTLITDAVDTYFMDVQTNTLYNGQTVHALRILEATTSGNAEARCDSMFNLYAGANYQLSYIGRVDTRKQDWAQDNFSPVGLLVQNTENRVLGVNPGAGNPIGNDWYQWTVPFQVPEGQGGAYGLSFLIDASGLQLDWYFSNARIEALN